MFMQQATARLGCQDFLQPLVLATSHLSACVLQYNHVASFSRFHYEEEPRGHHRMMQTPHNPSAIAWMVWSHQQRLPCDADARTRPIADARTDLRCQRDYGTGSVGYIASSGRGIDSLTNHLEQTGYL